jgi:hypothetical protein
MDQIVKTRQAEIIMESIVSGVLFAYSIGILVFFG